MWTWNTFDWFLATVVSNKLMPYFRQGSSLKSVSDKMLPCMCILWALIVSIIIVNAFTKALFLHWCRCTSVVWSVWLTGEVLQVVMVTHKLTSCRYRCTQIHVGDPRGNAWFLKEAGNLSGLQGWLHNHSSHTKTKKINDKMQNREFLSLKWMQSQKITMLPCCTSHTQYMM